MKLLNEFRQPEYIGENRCLACTTVNTVIALVITALIGAGMWSWNPSVSIIISTIILSISMCLIWLRGYLIPKTPALTKRYLPEWILSWFGKSPSQATEMPNISTEKILLDNNIIRQCENIDDLCLNAAFDQDWKKHLDTTDPDLDPIEFIQQLGMDENGISVDNHNDAIIVERDDHRIGMWPSELALRLDYAASKPLADRVDSWSVLPPAARSRLAAGVRIFLDECPNGNPVAFESETRESCCSDYEVVSVICTNSGERLLEQPIND